jgi:hypothetical protein
MLGFQITLKDFPNIFTNEQLIEILKVGKPAQEEDSLNQLIRMLHFFDGLVVLYLPEPVDPPVLQHARMQEVLIDGS